MCISHLLLINSCNKLHLSVVSAMLEIPEDHITLFCPMKYSTTATAIIPAPTCLSEA